MDRINLAIDQISDVARDVKEEGEGDVRTLKDLELVLAGGGDGMPGWP